MKPLAALLAAAAAVLATCSAIPLYADRLVLSDGRAFEGRVEEERAGELKFRAGKVSFWVPRSEVVRLDRDEDPTVELARRRARLAPGDADGRVRLASWCRERGLENAGRELLEQALALSPEHAEARRALGYVRVGASWKTRDEANLAAGLVRRPEGWVTPEDDRALSLLERFVHAEDDARERLLGAAVADGKLAWALVARARAGTAEAESLLAGGGGCDERATHEARGALLAARARLFALLRDPERYPSDRLPPEVQEEVRVLPRRIDRIAREPAGWWLEEGRASRAWAEARAAEDLLALRPAERLLVTAARLAVLARAADALPAQRVVEEASVQPFRGERLALEAKNEPLAADLCAEDRVLLRRTNGYRSLMGLRALLLEPRLSKAARAHSEDMERRGYFSHLAPEPARATVDRRAALEGFRSDVIGENLAEGASTPDEIFEAWRDSLGHHRNLLEPRFRRIGLGRSGLHWTMVLAGEEDR
ncbi:MAG: CAP domain-containing protein [Planctomycetes bacterium]|nr:CAP domain-containing protein [Planctomycetota bacterium]